MNKHKTHILMVLDQSFPPDVRVENEAVTLAKAGFDVTLLSISPEKKQAKESYKGFTIYRKYLPAQVRNKMRGLAGTFPFLSWYLQRVIAKINSEKAVDILHAHDLYLFGGVLKAGQKLNIPVVGDLHENYVEALKRYAWSTRPPGKWVISIPRWKKLEKKWVNAVDRLIVVIEEAAVRNKSLGVPEDRIVVVPNTINLDEFKNYPTEATYRDKYPTRFIITYTGGIDVHRGIESVIRAMPAIVNQIPNVLLTIVGDGRIKRELEQLTDELNIQNYVQFEGWKPQESVLGYMLSSDICLIPHLRTPHTDATIPHKLFHYMYAGRPIAASDCAPIKRIINDSHSGRTFTAGDSDSLAEVIVDMYKNEEERKEMAVNGQRAVRELYNWEVTSERLIQMYKELENNY